MACYAIYQYNLETIAWSHRMIEVNYLLTVAKGSLSEGIGNGILYRVSQEEWTKPREGVPYVKLYRYNPKHLYPKLNGYGDNGKRSLNI